MTLVPTAPLSVVIPCYGAGATVERAVLSVAAQEWRPTELILIDDASEDGTLALLDRFQRERPPGWVNIVRRSRNGGPGAARNDGWNLASQPFIAFLDADDAWHPAKTRVQLELMLRRPDVAISSVSYVPAGDGLATAPPAIRSIRSITFESLLYRNWLATSGTIVRRAVPTRFPQDRRLCEDYELFLTILAGGGKGLFIDAPLAFCYKRPYDGTWGHLWAMEKSQLQVFRRLRRERRIARLQMLFCCAFSLAKYARRVALNRWARLVAVR